MIFLPSTFLPVRITKQGGVQYVFKNGLSALVSVPRNSGEVKIQDKCGRPEVGGEVDASSL